MQEIWIPESIIFLLLLLPLIRPFVKGLVPLEGIAWLPAPALVAALTLFPAYGFRPEALPLAVYAALMAVRLLADRRTGGSFQRQRFISALLPLMFLVLAALTAFFFTPPEPTDFSVQGVHTLTARTAEREYAVRIYSGEEVAAFPRRPLLILLAPTPGGLAAVDKVAGELRDRGFTVLVAARGKGGGGLADWFRFLHPFRSGTVSAAANARGRALEAARREDILFLLSWVAEGPRPEGGLPLFSMASRESVFLAAYDAGGSALVLLGNSPSLTGRPPSPEGLQIRGIIALESPLWSLYREESSQIPGLPPNAGWFPSVRHGLKQWFLQWKPKKITGLKPVPELSLPLLLLVSPRAWESKHRARYEAVFAAFDAARAAAVLAAAPGAGPLDYSDIPVRYPLVSAFFWRGSSGPGGGAREAPGKTADIITHFAVQILEAGAAGASSLLQTTPLPPGSRWEQRN